MRVIAHHGIEPLLPAMAGVGVIAVHYLRALMRVRPWRRRPEAPLPTQGEPSRR